MYGFFLLFASWRFAEPRKWLAEIRSTEPPKPVTPEPTLLGGPETAKVCCLPGAGIIS
ncbi:MAG: hypothetical protein IPK19_13070 [Chloroflexi bacterium]|nr:hypothetical protein [Chloroflexota bacterium]